jgi:hypothetical protein
MISAEAPILFAKACELFVLELSMRSWIEAEAFKHRTLQRTDVLRAISKCDEFDFLMYTIPQANEANVVSLPPPIPGSSKKYKAKGPCGAASALLLAAGVVETDGSDYTGSPMNTPRADGSAAENPNPGNS